MQNLFYCFGFIYIVQSFYKLYNWKYGDKFTVKVNEYTTIEDLEEIREEFESQSKTTLSVIANINGYLCFFWALFGSFSNVTESKLFTVLMLLVVFYYGFMVTLGIFIGYQSITNISPRIVDINEDKTPKNNFPLCQMIEVTKILIVSFILFKYFL